MEQKNSVEFRQRGEGEYDIPGFPCYTIDDDMVVRSYYCGVQYIKKKKVVGGSASYNLYGYTELGIRVKHRFSAVRLLLCAKANINPLASKCCDFIYDRGAVSAKYQKLIYDTPTRVTSVITRHEIAKTPREVQCACIRRHAEENAIMLRAIESGDYVELLAALDHYREAAVKQVCSHGYRLKIAQAIVSEGIDIILERVKNDCIPIASLRSSLIHTCRLVIKQRRERIV